MWSKVCIIGIAPDGPASLPARVRQTVERAEILCGGKRLLAMFPSAIGRKVAIKDNLATVADLIKTNLGQKRIVVLASGDPGFYGVARYLTERLGKDNFDIMPNVSAMQLAFARIGESWDDAALASVHSRPIENIVEVVRNNRKVGVFTDGKNSPREIAKVLLDNGVDNCLAYVCQDLGTKSEKVVAADLRRLRRMDFSALNTMIIVKDKVAEDVPVQQVTGIADDSFRKPMAEGNLITKLEVRAISLARLGLRPDSFVWDVGTGSGAVAIEAALLAGKGKVFAVEKNASALAAVRENVEKFGRRNVEVVRATAPAKLADLPAPDAVFIGGSGSKMAGILRVACRRLKPGGRIVVNAATLETMHAAVQGLKANGFVAEVTLVNVARSKEIAGLTRFEPLNPVFIITGWREVGGSNAG